MPNSLHSSVIGSPASRRATNCILSSITEHSFQGIASSPRGGSVTHVSGTMCYLCLRPLTVEIEGSISARNVLVMPVGEGFELPEQPDITFTKCEELDLLNHGCMFPKVFVTRVRRRAWKEMGKVDKVEVVNSSSASSMPLPWVASKNH